MSNTIPLTEDAIERKAERMMDAIDARRGDLTDAEYTAEIQALNRIIEADYATLKQPDPVTLQRGQHINIDCGREGYPVVQVAVDQFGNYTLRIVEPGMAGQPDKVVFHEVVTSMAFFAGR